jgi:hypothetical protein
LTRQPDLSAAELWPSLLLAGCRSPLTLLQAAMYLNKVPSSATHGFLAAGTSVNSFRVRRRRVVGWMAGWRAGWEARADLELLCCSAAQTCSQDSDEACMPQSSKPAAAAATATLEHELGRQRERATAAERALAESHKANELLAGRVLALQVGRGGSAWLDEWHRSVTEKAWAPAMPPHNRCWCCLSARLLAHRPS